ncbi:MAG: hypothetical protein ACRDJ5_10055 [Actinomycetota bacterium]
MTDLSLSVRAGRVALYLLCGAGALALMSGAGQIWRYYSGTGRFNNIVERFFVDSEQSIPTWYQVVMLLGCVSIAAFITLLEKGEGGGFVRHWGALAFILALLSIDEAVSFHELAGEAMTRYIGSLGFVQYTWVVLGIAVVVAFVVYFRSFFARLDRRDRRSLGAALALYVAGALGMEIVTGLYVAGRGLVPEGTTDVILDPFHGIVLTTLEESLEMGGIIMLVYALLMYVGRHHPSVAVRLSGAGVEGETRSSGRS